MVRLIDITLPTPEENLALDEALLIALEETTKKGAQPREDEALRFWESPIHFVVLGRRGNLRDEVDVEACSLNGIPILRRVTGGGTVLQGPGCLNFSLVLSLENRPELRDFRNSYATILGRVAKALGLEGTRLCGISDLTLDDSKISGNAQKRTRNGLLHQGTILSGFNIALIARFLREPKKQPAYRERRPHSAFVRNIPLPVGEIKSRISTAWDATAPCPGFELPEIRSLVAGKYANRDWVESF